MPDEVWKKAQSQPLAGESDLHFKGKDRLRSLLRRSGFYAELEHRFLCVLDGAGETTELEHRSDVYGVSPERVICCEVDGPKGHKTTRAFNRDALKQRRIKAVQGNANIEYYTFHYKRIVGAQKWTDQEIVEEMKITTLDRPRTKWL
jgi:hypothetical protein